MTTYEWQQHKDKDKTWLHRNDNIRIKHDIGMTTYDYILITT